MIALRVAGEGLATGSVVLLSTRQRSGRELELGAVSNQWVAKHRLVQTHDAHR
jgi:hypothetical protein